MSLFTKKFIITATVLATVAFVFIVSKLVFPAMWDNSTATVGILPQGMNEPRLTRLVIPALKIDAAIQNVGLTESGAVGVPTTYRDVGWYALGAFPGEEGTAIMDGHYDNALALPGVFKRLGRAQIGDAIQVKTKNGDTVSFIVTDVASYDYDDVPPGALVETRPGAFLKLVTCGGDWVPRDKTYGKRVIVTAILQ